jgi:hypothetical protein
LWERELEDPADFLPVEISRFSTAFFGRDYSNIIKTDETVLIQEDSRMYKINQDEEDRYQNKMSLQESKESCTVVYSSEKSNMRQLAVGRNFRSFRRAYGFFPR